MAVELEYFGVPPADYREVESRYRYVAAAGQTTFNGAYSVNFLDVFINGAKLDPVTEFTATNGTNVVLAAACVGGEIIELISRRQVTPQDIYSRSQVDTLMSNYYGITTGSGDALVLATTPSFTVLTDGMQVKARTHAANTVSNPTINVNGIGARQIMTYNQQVCTIGDYSINSEITLRYNQALDRWLIVEGALTAVAPAQFDNTAKFATTSFVQRALGNFQTFAVITGGTTVTAAQTGSMIAFTGTSYTVNLPTAAIGLTYTFYNSASGNITLAAPAGLIYNSGASGTSFVMNPSSSIKMVCDGTNWIILNSGNFVFSANTSGYQRLPSGIIIQWAGTGSIASGSSTTVTFPIVFPNAVLQVMCSAQASSNSTTPVSGGWQVLSSSQFTLRNLSASSGQYSWIAIGY